MTHQKTFTLEELAQLTETQLAGNGKHCISNVADLKSAQATDASFLASPKYEKAMHSSSAGVIFIDTKTPPVEGRNFLIAKIPSIAFQKVVDTFYPQPHEQSGFQGVHPAAAVHPSAIVGKNVTVGPCAVIDQNAEIGDNTFIGAGTYVGASVTMGKACVIHPNVTIREKCFLGDRVVIQPGAVIGLCGFGYTPDEKGDFIKLSQIGTVTIEDDVEIGANVTIERASFKTTRIGRGTKISDLVGFGHNVNIGDHNIIVGQTGIAGSTETGSYATFGAQVGVAGHIKIAANTTFAARTAVSKSILKPGIYGGAPVAPYEEFHKTVIHNRNLDKHVKALKELQKKVQELEAKIPELMQ